MNPDVQSFLLATGKTIGLPLVSAGATHWWHTRKHHSIFGLEVSLSKHVAKIEPDLSKNKEEPLPLPAILFTFSNVSNETIYLHRTRLTRLSVEIQPHSDSQFDIANHTYELKFRDEITHQYCSQEIVLHTSQKAYTTICLANTIPFPLRPKPRKWLPPAWLCDPDYFTLEFEATKGKRNYRISTKY